jgi:hypothetical protein
MKMPAEVLEKCSHANAEKLLPGLAGANKKP